MDSVLDGTADLASIVEETKKEEFVVDETELEIERKQEAQRIALMHGGFTNLIDFEKALMDGAGAGFHDSHGYGGMGMGGIPANLKKPSNAGVKSSNTASSATAKTTSTTPGSASSDTTATPQKEDEAAEKPPAAPESVKVPAPVVEDKQKPVGEEILDQVVLEVAKDQDAEASPASSTERPKDEL